MRTAEVPEQIEATGVVAIIRAASSGELIDVVNALREGGVTCIEVTMTTPNALDVIRAAREKVGEAAAIGVGTVLDAETARAAILAGAQFVVAPIVDLPTIELCRRYSVPVLPGALTPTEIVRAWQAGAEFVKVFPTGSLGSQYLTDLRGPLPHIRLVPTGGITLENADEFIRAGASALGVGSALVRKDWLKKRDFAAIKQAAGQWLQAVKQARES
ncbi:MAG: bifunctional 4-hydroxy-2-oxoglutarate aldolase/2-dehydro-3-deoxy-phosphogluconate aldolase [Planctomycetes bacterium]|nr:bifunctional 4-hydroxy-2-oxoglutarate aldolase/2-dehydro-3-deoxy-phosphogluconate aldolase [Planctomycetota bacterium]